MLFVLTSTSISITEALAPSVLGRMLRFVFQCRRLAPFIFSFHCWMKPTSWSCPANLLKVPSGVKVPAHPSASPESMAWL